MSSSEEDESGTDSSTSTSAKRKPREAQAARVSAGMELAMSQIAAGCASVADAAAEVVKAAEARLAAEHNGQGGRGDADLGRQGKDRLASEQGVPNNGTSDHGLDGVAELREHIALMEAKMDKVLAVAAEQAQLANAQREMLAKKHEEMLAVHKEELARVKAEQAAQAKELVESVKASLPPAAPAQQAAPAPPAAPPPPVNAQAKAQEEKIAKLESELQSKTNEVAKLLEEKRMREEMEMLLSDDSEGDILQRTVATSFRSNADFQSRLSQGKPGESNPVNSAAEGPSQPDALEQDSMVLPGLSAPGAGEGPVDVGEL